jgi:hypothetical protein
MDRKCDSEMGISQSRHSRRIVPMTRSQIAFAFGQRGGDFRRTASAEMRRAPGARCAPVLYGNCGISLGAPSFRAACLVREFLP